MESCKEADDTTTHIFDRTDDILNLDDSEESFVILQKDGLESMRSSSPNEGVSECDNSDQQSSFSSVSHSQTENDFNEIIDTNKKLRKERFEKIAMYQKEVLSTLHEITQKLDLIKSSTDESNNDIDSSVMDSSDIITQNETMLDSSSKQESEVSLENVDLITQTSLTAETQCVSAETESVTLDNVETDTPATEETQCMSTEAEVRTTEIATDKPVESVDSQAAQTSNIMMVQSSSSVEALANTSTSLSVEQCVAFTKLCDQRIEEIESEKSCILFNSSLTEHDLAERRKKVTDFHNEICEEKNKIIEQWRASLNYAELEVPVTKPLTFERFEEEKDMRKMLEKEVSLLRESCAELTKKLEVSKVEHDALLMEKNNTWSEERRILIATNALLEYELESRDEKYEVLKKENDLLKTFSDTIRVDLDNSKAELADARMMISELQAQNSDLQESENAVDIYKRRNEMQEIDIFRLSASEKSYLCQIELLTDENKILRDYINHFLSR